MSTRSTGIALDIDDTLSQTLLYWIEGLQEKFGGVEGLSPREIVKKYKHTRNIPHWNTPEAFEYITKLCNSDSLQEVIPVMENAVEAVQKISAIVPIVAYITARPNTVSNGTKKWLQKHGFPNAPLITRPPSVSIPDGIVWKAQTLMSSFPHVQGIVDNDVALVDSLPAEYPGHFFLLHDDIHKTISHNRVVLCPNWNSVVQQMQTVFSNTSQ